MFYDSKTTLFNWAGSWRGAAAQLLKKHGAKVAEQEFVETWVRKFEGLHRRAAFFRYTQVTDIVREALRERLPDARHPRRRATTSRRFSTSKRKSSCFPTPKPRSRTSRTLGVKVFIYSDVETKYLDMYVAKFKAFKADFVGTTEQAGVAKPNPRTYQWVLRKTGLEARDVLYCAAPMFDIQGAMSAGMIAAWLRRPEGRLSKETHTAGDLAADFEVESLHDITRILELTRGTH